VTWKACLAHQPINNYCNVSDPIVACSLITVTCLCRQKCSKFLWAWTNSRLFLFSLPMRLLLLFQKTSCGSSVLLILRAKR